MPLAASKCSTMTVVPARRQGGRISKQKSGHNIHIQNYGNLCIGVATGMTKGHPIDRGRMFSPEKEGMGFDGAVGGGSTESSGSDVSRARPKGYGVRIANAAPQHSSSSEALAHAIVRGFRVGAARKLPEFLERRASPCNATAENMVGIKKSRLDGDALIITVKAADLPKVTGINGVLFAGTRLMIRPYRAKGSVPETQVAPAKETLVSQMEPSIRISNADSTRLTYDVLEDRAQPAEMALPASPCSESSEPDVDTSPLPASNCLAAAAAAAAAAASTEYLQQQDPNFAAPEGTEIETVEQKMAIQLSKATGISLATSNLLLPQADYNEALTIEAIVFAADFAKSNGLSLQSSILCLDNSLWNVEDASLISITLAKEVSDRTGMTIDWAVECLHASGWMVEKALKVFKADKHLLPHEAFFKK